MPDISAGGRAEVNRGDRKQAAPGSTSGSGLNIETEMALSGA
jgi:hypothetical protein